MKKVMGLILASMLLNGCMFRLEIEISRSKPQKKEVVEPELKLFKLPFPPSFNLPSVPIDPPGMPPFELPDSMRPMKKEPEIKPGPNTAYLLIKEELQLPDYF